MNTIQEYFEIDGRKKDGEWANKLISHFRLNWGRLVDEKRARDGMNYILSNNDMDKVKKMFADPSQTGFDFVPIAIMEKLRNILIAERNKAGIFITLNALDTSAVNEKNGDYQLLKNRNEIEQTISGLQQQIGLPEYKLSNEKKLNGKDAFNGNIDQFDEANLSDTEEYHIDYFFKTHYKLRHEQKGQQLINYFIRYNELKNNIDFWCNDILAKKAIALRTFVNEITGAIEYKYITPDVVKLIPGKRRDGKDAVCIGYEESFTVSDVIKLIGNSFKWDEEIDNLMRAVNHSNGTSFTGIFDEAGNRTYGTREGSNCTYSQFLQFKVGMGYIEWKSIDANAYKTGKDYHGNYRMIPVKPDHEVDKRSIYKKESYYNEVTYKSFFLILSSTTQKLYKFGKLFCQNIEGTEDEYSNYSIIIRKQEGPTVAEIAQPFIEIAQEAFYKFKWMIRKAKPKGRAYSYESLVKVAQKMIGSGNKISDIHQVIKMFEDGINEIFTIPEIDGQKLGGGTNPNYDKMNGLDPSTMQFSSIIDWAVTQISDKVGINSIREAYSPNPNDGYKLQMQTLQQSRNATDYMSQMILSVLENCGKYTLGITQDILRYKESIPYKFLKQALGEEVLKDLEEMNGYTFHRYGIFIDTFNNDIERQEIKAATMDAWTKGEINFETMLMVNGVDDPKTAGMVLSFEKWRKQKEDEKKIAAQQQNAMAIEDKKHANEMELEAAKGKNIIDRANVEGKWYYEALKAGADARVQAQNIRVENEPQKIDLKTNAEIKRDTAKANLKLQEPLEP